MGSSPWSWGRSTVHSDHLLPTVTMLILQDTNHNCSKALSLPDLGALASPEPELPTLNLDLACDPLQVSPVASIHLDPLQVGTEGHYRVSPLAPVLDLLDSMNNYGSYRQDVGYSTSPSVGQMEQKPSVRILEQPKSNSLRFRYQCEGRGAGALQGANSTPELKTYPKIKIEGYQGPAVVVVSCVAHDGDKPKAHPHNLVSPAAVGREGCKRGVCTMNVPWQPGHQEDMTVEFQHLGIQCVRRKDIGEALKQREAIRVDPFRQGFDHINSPQSIDLNAVKLCFQVFLENPNQPGKYTVSLPAVCSQPIYDAKAKKTLQIMDISDTFGPEEGGKKIIILCGRVARDDIKIRFYDPNTNWEGWGDFNAQEVHKQYAITFKTPSYMGKEGKLTEKKTVLVELLKPSDDSTSEPHEFTIIPRGYSASQAMEKPRSEYKSSQHTYTNIGSMWTVKKEKEDGGWGLPPAFPHVPESPYRQPEMQTSHPYIPNIPNPYPAHAYPHHMGSSHHTIHQEHTKNHRPVQQNEMCFQGEKNQMGGQMHMNNIYGAPQPSPDSQSFAEMKIRSPPHQEDDEVDKLSGKIEFISLTGAPSLSDVVSLSLDMQQQNNGEERRGPGKRGAKTAALESGSLTVPPTQGRFIDTPEVSGQLNTPNNSSHLSGHYQLNNCPRVNDI